ncbi:unnamed protein product [Caenorhabditis sp. 36 PRJEB53466]|nr:unnamed protein product [Caenorhabditis sp. 36 PRJEB53466]
MWPDQVADAVCTGCLSNLLVVLTVRYVDMLTDMLIARQKQFMPPFLSVYLPCLSRITLCLLHGTIVAENLRTESIISFVSRNISEFTRSVLSLC